MEMHNQWNGTVVPMIVGNVSLIVAIFLGLAMVRR
jgi:hypothetical protein